MKFIKIGDTIVNTTQIFNVTTFSNFIRVTNLDDQDCVIRFNTSSEAKKEFEKLLTELNKEDK